MTENRRFLHCIIVTMILTSTHDSAIRWGGPTLALPAAPVEDAATVASTEPPINSEVVVNRAPSDG
jgi:hypothetical protein